MWIANEKGGQQQKIVTNNNIVIENILCSVASVFSG